MQTRPAKTEPIPGYHVRECLGTGGCGEVWKAEAESSGKVVAMDARCPHMGVHLAEGRVEGDGLRCFFHRWKFEGNGKCSDIPALPRPLNAGWRRWRPG